MNIFSIDTSTKILSMAYCRKSLLFKYNKEVKGALSVHLLEEFDKFIKEHSIDTGRDIDVILMGSGPGSFTSLRMGYTFTKMLAYAKNIHLYTISSIYSTVYKAVLEKPFLKRKRLVTALDAKRSDLFYAIMEFSGEDLFIEPGEINIFHEPKLISDNIFRSLLYNNNCGKDYCFLVDRPEIFNELKEAGREVFLIGSYPDASVAVYLIKISSLSKDILSLEPDYFRKSDAEINYEKRIIKGEI